MAPLKAGGEHIPVSITVLDQEGMDFLFGLDNLKRHQCNIDLQANCLRFPALKIELPFLSEHEIPKNIFTEAQQQAQAEQSAQPVPPPQQQRQQQQSTQPAVPQQQEFSSEKINVLMQLGFPREKCIAALRAAGGNEEMAASLLFSM
jgi:DNA damage-inducible protein 1